ncbi:type II toxin-antitoxin system RelE family toxin [Desulfonatronovibrio magnus]|uniref:type II toxin-antitoxin system RelE family toxin n=1 Tax=Desulfonatronovibrio magnus TaxID=698827 RepID=UPI0005EB0D4D|nr:type II toxin-antitoxin system RelE/ParE family toxin [Desulfonatronovibrio magnus]
MGWTIRYLKSARKDALKLDPQSRLRIRNYLEKRVAKLDDPKTAGEPLKGNLAEFWRYRVGPYRVICEIRNQELVILVIRVRHRKEAYKP